MLARSEPNIPKGTRSVLSVMIFSSRTTTIGHSGRAVEGAAKHPNHAFSRGVGLQTGSRMITHSTILSFFDFIDLFKAFNLRCRKDLGDLFERLAVSEPALE